MFASLLMFAVLLGIAGKPTQVKALDESQVLQAKLHTTLDDYTLTADNFLEGLMKVASQLQIPLGVEWVRTPATLQKVRLSWKHTNVQQVFEELVKKQPGYKYEVIGNVLHVFPERMRSSKRDFLNLRIEKFEVRNVVVATANHKLRELIKLKVSPPQPAPGHPGEGGIGYSQLTSGGELKLSIGLKDVSVREILNKLALASDRKIWVVTFSGDLNLTPTGFRRTFTLWNKRAIPDSEQPVWDMFRWGEAIP